MKTEKTLEQPTGTTKILIPYARVSSVIQTADDKTGIERQLLSARRCVAAHPGWKLDETFNLIDPAKSGYKGANLEPDAALGGFLKMLEDGKLPLTPTKVLHIDDMSRLSRLPIQKARKLFEGILEAGVEIYVHQDTKLYTKESLNNSMDLIVSLLRIEAATKYASDLGDKIKSAWTIKKSRLTEDGKSYRFHTHAWLKWNDATQSYDLDPEKAKHIKRVFELACMGIGVRGIAKRMNRDGIPPLTNYPRKNANSAIWSNSVVERLLNRKNVLGYNENLTPPVLMYPPVISEKIYYTAQAKIAERRTHKYYGRSADKANNLFAGLTHCSKCDRSMYFSNHIREWTPLTGSKGGKMEYAYLICTGVKEGACENSMLRYDKTEESFAMQLSGSAFVNQYAETKPEAGSTLETLKGKIADTNTRLEHYATDYEKSPSDMLAGLMTKTETTVKELRQELEAATTAQVGTSPLTDTRNELLAILYKGWNDIDVRLKLRELIRAVVDKIIVNGPDKCYTIHWKNGDKPTVVQILRKAYKIDGLLIPSRPDWEKEIVKAGEVIKRLEGQKITPEQATLIEKERKALNVELLKRVKVPVV